MKSVNSSFTNAIEKEFYDKQVYKVPSQALVDEEGWARMAVDDPTQSFMANIVFQGFEQIQEDYGLSKEIDGIMTCLPLASVSLGEIVSYNNQLYKMIDVRQFDSHKLIGIKEWSSKSSGSIAS